MVRILEKYRRNTDSVRKSGEYIMRVSACACSHKRVTTLSIVDVREVAFHPGEEIEAVIFFVDTNRNVLLQTPGFRYASGFAPRPLYYQYIDYLLHGIKPHDIEPLPVLKCFHKKKRGGYQKKEPFSTYVKQRVSPELLQDSESLFRDRKFVDTLLKRK